MERYHIYEDHTKTPGRFVITQGKLPSGNTRIVAESPFTYWPKGLDLRLCHALLDGYFNGGGKERCEARGARMVAIREEDIWPLDA